MAATGLVIYLVGLLDEGCFDERPHERGLATVLGSYHYSAEAFATVGDSTEVTRPRIDGHDRIFHLTAVANVDQVSEC